MQNVLTFFIDRGWNEKDWEYTNRSISHGNEALNEVVNDLARRVPVLSISYTSMPFPGGLMRLFATVLYRVDHQHWPFMGQGTLMGRERSLDTPL